MRSTLAIAKRILLQFAHDKRTLGLLFFAPMLVLWLLTVLLGAGDYQPRLATVNLPSNYQTYLEQQDCTIQDVSAEQGEELLRSNQVDAVLSMGEDQTLIIWAEGSDVTKTSACKKVALEAMSDLSKDASEQIKADIEDRKAQIQDLKSEAQAKQAEAKSKISQKQNEIASAAQNAQATQAQAAADLKSKLSNVATMINTLKASIKEIVPKLPAEEQAQYAGLLASLDSMNFDPNSIKLPDASDAGINLGSSLNIDTNIQFPDTDFSMEMSDYLPVQSVDVTYLHGNGDWKMFDFYGPVFIGIFLFVFVFITSGMSLVNERSAGTMERFLATPVNPFQILGGYVIGFGVLASIQAAVVLWFSLNVMHFPNEGNILLVILIVVLLALVSVTLGLLVSGLASNAFQVIQLMLVFVVPQVLLSGLFNLSTAPEWMQVLSQCFPITYGVDALRQVMLRGADLATIGVNVAVLVGFIAAFFTLAALRFRKKHAKRQS